MIRRLYLGSVSSLSFEEEENEFCCARKNHNGDGGVGDKQNGDAEAGLNMELHEMLTDRLYEQVSAVDGHGTFQTSKLIRLRIVRN